MTSEQLLEYLKYCVVEKNKPKLKEKLAETVDLRRKMLKQNKEDFKEFMSFYFVDPELVGKLSINIMKAEILIRFF